jgi:uncharacterized membrane protein
MTSASWAMMLVVTVNAIFFHAMPRFSRPDILFAVTVPDAFVAGAGRTLVSRYRAIVWGGAAAGLAISLWLPAPPPSSGRGEDATPDHAWKVGGLVYFNPLDPAIWVENRVGLGYTLNLGNPRAWLLIIGMMLAPMIASRLLF